MSAKKSRKDNISTSAAQAAAPAEHTEKTPVPAAPQQGCCTDNVFSRKDVFMVVLYSVLLLLSMTVQTGTVSMILCVLALLSLLGKKPLLKARQRLFTKQAQERQRTEDHAHGAGLDGHGEHKQHGIKHHHEGVFPEERALSAAAVLRGGGLGRRGGNVIFS